MNSIDKFTGAGVAIITPFREDSSIDFKCFEKLINYILDNQVNYLVVLGTTGESVTLNKDEKKALINFVIEVNRDRVPIVVGLGGNNTHEIVNQIKSNSFNGIDAILSVAPYYNKPNQQGLFQHYKTIADSCPVPVILYNVPGRTGVNMNAETTLELAHQSTNIIAIKEASGDLDQITKILKDKPEHFSVISGDDTLIQPVISLGGIGVISVLANAFPARLSELVSFALKGELEKTRDLHFQFSEIIDLLFVDGNPAGIKAVLHQMNMISNALRLPLTPVTGTTYNKISRILSKLDR
jgi:4-hydroxy-tetrahydrodipicolinate synthase